MSREELERKLHEAQTANRAMATVLEHKTAECQMLNASLDIVTQERDSLRNLMNLYFGGNKNDS